MNAQRENEVILRLTGLAAGSLRELWNCQQLAMDAVAVITELQEQASLNVRLRSELDQTKKMNETLFGNQEELAKRIKTLAAHILTIRRTTKEAFSDEALAELIGEAS